MSEAPPLPAGFAVGHWTHAQGGTGCTVVIPPPGTRAAADVRGGGPGTREIEVLESRANPQEATAVVFAGGSAFGLAAADGAARWLEEHGRGYEAFTARVPLVPAAVIYDLVDGQASARPDADSGYAACEAAEEGVPERGRVGAGAGAAAGKARGRERATPAGVGYAALRVGSGETVAALAVANPSGDVLAEDGSVLAGPREDDGSMGRSSEIMLGMSGPPEWAVPGEREATTLACVCTDAGLTKAGCGVVARMASAGIARAVDPVFSPSDGDVAFCLASGKGEADRWTVMAVGTAAATVTAAAIRDSVRQAAAT
jgi:L-aminopeptidase/D-esterase-like protein